MDNNLSVHPSSPKRILSIEDEHSISQLYMKTLTKAGYQVQSVFDGIEGYEAAKTDAYDIILLDLMLPNMSGMEILRRLRSEVPNLKAKIVVATNLEQEQQHRQSIEQRADAYLIKANLTPRQLVEFLSHIR